MKCPYCGGTGKEIIFTNVGKCIADCLECKGKGVIEPMTKKDYCNNCWGTGKVPDFWDNDKEVICPHCSGTGMEPPMTNDEWRRTCSTEEFSKWLENKMTWAAQEQGTFTAKGWEKWLKQPHKREEKSK